jgi:hypothetical protein
LLVYLPLLNFFQAKLNPGYQYVGYVAIPYKDYEGKADTRDGKKTVSFRCQLVLDGVNVRPKIIWKVRISRVI